jgi:hypothetical protein
LPTVDSSHVEESGTGTELHDCLLLSMDKVVDRRGVEPLTSAVQRRRSPN